MIAPPTFASNQEYSSRLGDVGYWWPYVSEILKRHGLAEASREPVAGVGGSYPTFLIGDLVVKLFGHVPPWRESFAAEHAAHLLLATDPEITAPGLLAAGHLCEDEHARWPYLITKRMPGVAWRYATLSPEQQLAVAADLGCQVRRVHTLRPSGITTYPEWPALKVAAAAAQSSLPPHLVAQVDEFCTRLGPPDRVFVHCDIVGDHVFVENGRLTGIIDWGDATVADRHTEIVQPFRDMFGCNKALLRSFLDGSNWPVSNDFPQRALGFALHRQAIGLLQHLTIDVFEPIAALYPLQEIATLDELATELFAL
jgi:hypothetical protein